MRNKFHHHRHHHHHHHHHHRDEENRIDGWMGRKGHHHKGGHFGKMSDKMGHHLGCNEGNPWMKKFKSKHNKRHHMKEKHHKFLHWGHHGYGRGFKGHGHGHAHFHCCQQQEIQFVLISSESENEQESPLERQVEDAPRSPSIGIQEAIEYFSELGI